MIETWSDYVLKVMCASPMSSLLEGALESDGPARLVSALEAIKQQHATSPDVPP